MGHHDCCLFFIFQYISYVIGNGRPAHGGQFRIPILNKGIISPGQGMIPKYAFILYKFGNRVMVISRGIGDSIIPVRIHNCITMIRWGWCLMLCKR